MEHSVSVVEFVISFEDVLIVVTIKVCVEKGRACFRSWPIHKVDKILSAKFGENN